MVLTLKVLLLSSAFAVSGPTTNDDDHDDDIVEYTLGGRKGVWMSDEAMRDVLVGAERDKKKIVLDLANERLLREASDKKAAALQSEVESAAARSIWFPILTGLAGVLLTSAVMAPFVLLK